MSSFAFLLAVMIVGILLWWLVDAAKYPKVSKAGFVMFVVGLAAICYGAHPYIPGMLR
jgi:uncharacterized membrane protein